MDVISPDGIFKLKLERILLRVSIILLLEKSEIEKKQLFMP